MGAAEWSLLLLLALVWGGSFFFVRIAVSELPPLTVVLGRVLIGALLLNLIVVASGHRLPSRGRLWGALVVMGLLNNVIPFCLIVWGQTRIASGLASILYASTSLFTVLLAPIFTADERITPARLAGVLVGLVGVAIMIGPDLLVDTGGTTLAKLAILGASIAYALSSIWGRRFCGIPPAVTAAGQLSVATMVMAPLALVVNRPWALPAPSLRALGAIAALGLLSTTVGYLLSFARLARAGAINGSLVTLLVPPTALLLGALFLGEIVDARDLLGLALIAAGLVVIDGRAARWLLHRLEPQHAATGG
jgi:drug/metabolite transporter (DMT)-like permease